MITPSPRGTARIGDSDVVDSAGVILSGVAMLLLLCPGWKGGELVYRHRVGVADADQTPIV